MKLGRKEPVKEILAMSGGVQVVALTAVAVGVSVVYVAVYFLGTAIFPPPTAHRVQPIRHRF